MWGGGKRKEGKIWGGEGTFALLKIEISSKGREFLGENCVDLRFLFRKIDCKL